MENNSEKLSQKVIDPDISNAVLSVPSVHHFIYGQKFKTATKVL